MQVHNYTSNDYYYAFLKYINTELNVCYSSLFWLQDRDNLFALKTETKFPLPTRTKTSKYNPPIFISWLMETDLLDLIIMNQLYSLHR